MSTALENEVSEARHSISSDGYPMSIGEITNLYKSGELIIRPEFQRFFRWTGLQKSRLVESILLGIPLPSIFVAQNDSGVWELVDGLQRISTILQLQGELEAEPGVKADPLVLSATKYLPSLEGKVWESDNPNGCLSSAQRLDIKRSKIDLKIIKRESSPQAKFDLFQRLNSYGIQANAQEMRSALIVAISPEFLVWLESLTHHPSFQECVPLNERLIEERYDLELVTRFLFLHNMMNDMLSLSKLRDLPNLLDDWSIKSAQTFPEGVYKLEAVFKSTFDHISDNGSEFIFKRYDPNKNESRGSFLNTSFEIFALGTGYNIANGIKLNKNLVSTVKDFWRHQKAGFATGKSTEARLVEFIPLGRKLTAEDSVFENNDLWS